MGGGGVGRGVGRGGVASGHRRFSTTLTLECEPGWSLCRRGDGTRREQKCAHCGGDGGGRARESEMQGQQHREKAWHVARRYLRRRAAIMGPRAWLSHGPWLDHDLPTSTSTMLHGFAPPLIIDWSALCAPPPPSDRAALEDALASAARAWSARLASHRAAAAPASPAPVPRTTLEAPYGFLLDIGGAGDGGGGTAATGGGDGSVSARSLLLLVDAVHRLIPLDADSTSAALIAPSPPPPLPLPRARAARLASCRAGIHCRNRLCFARGAAHGQQSRDFSVFQLRR